MRPEGMKPEGTRPERVRLEGGGPDGPLVGLCSGHRCAALRRLAPGEPLEGLGAAVRATPGALLLRTDCPGACALGALGVVARRDGSSGRPGRPLWLAGVERAERARALVAWVAAGGPASLDDPARDLPAALDAAVVPVVLPSGVPDR